MNWAIHCYLLFCVTRLPVLFEVHFFMIYESKYLGDMMFSHENHDSTTLPLQGKMFHTELSYSSDF